MTMLIIVLKRQQATQQLVPKLTEGLGMLTQGKVSADNRMALIILQDKMLVVLSNSIMKRNNLIKTYSNQLIRTGQLVIVRQIGQLIAHPIDQPIALQAGQALPPHPMVEVDLEVVAIIPLAVVEVMAAEVVDIPEAEATGAATGN